MKHRIVLILFFALSLPAFAGSAVFAPFYEDSIPYCREIANTAETYASTSDAVIIPSLLDIPENTSTLYIVAHGNEYGILGADDEPIGWSSIIISAVEAGVSTIIIDTCSSGSAIVVAQHLKIDISFEIYTSASAGEPSRANIGGASLFSSIWTEHGPDAIKPYDSFGSVVSPQYAAINNNYN